MSLPFKTYLLGVQESMKQGERGEVDYTYEYLDMARFNGREYNELLYQYLQKKYAENQPDLIITHFEPAGNFIKSYGEKIFPGVPAVIGL